jgi:spermidine/putrescine transport system substrate-binding protein
LIHDIALFLLSGIVLLACSRPASPPQAATPTLAEELIVYGWSGYLPQSILDSFTKEYGVRVNYETYGTQEEAVLALQAGKSCDVLIMGIDLIQTLVQADLLAEINYRHIPNFQNVSPNFRELAYDPGNKYSVLIQWGTAGLVVRTDLVAAPVKQWADLWDERHAGKIGLWALPRDVIGLGLKSLGYSVNSEDPAELEAALARLIQLKPRVFFLDLALSEASTYLVSGEATIIYGWSYDVLEARKKLSTIDYVLPEEGALLWGDNLTIPANSPNGYTAELFINFLLRPEISAQFTNEIYVATPNEAARDYIHPEILADPIIFPPEALLQEAEILFSLSPEGQRRHDEIWQRFLAAPPVGPG